jgi:hypothetical protein
MSDQSDDMNRELMVDGNAVAGLLQDVFGLEMTASPAECANCGQVNELGALLTFTQAPGAVLRCPACEEVILRIVETPDAIYLDARGAARIRLQRRQT